CTASWLVPGNPRRSPPLAYAVGAVYVGYAAVLVVYSWAPESQLVRFRFATHVIDLLAYTAILFFTNGATSPFFVFLLFALAAAALRWEWPGVLATAAAALVAYVGVASETAPAVVPGGTLLTIVIRSTYLAVFAVLLGFLGSHH